MNAAEDLFALPTGPRLTILFKLCSFILFCSFVVFCSLAVLCSYVMMLFFVVFCVVLFSSVVCLLYCSLFLSSFVFFTYNDQVL